MLDGFDFLAASFVLLHREEAFSPSIRAAVASKSRLLAFNNAHRSSRCVSVLCFFVSRRSLPSNLQKRVSFEAMSADEAMEDGESEDCEVLIVDPPRKVCFPPLSRLFRFLLEYASPNRFSTVFALIFCDAPLPWRNGSIQLIHSPTDTAATVVLCEKKILFSHGAIFSISCLRLLA